MSRLETVTVAPVIRETDLDEVVPMALRGVPEGSVELDIPETLPMVAVDRGLLERAVADIVENAVKYGPRRPAGARVGERDRRPRRSARGGPAAPVSPTRPRSGSSQPSSATGTRGAGVGLAIARGFVEAMGGTLTADGTPAAD